MLHRIVYIIIISLVFNSCSSESKVKAQLMKTAAEQTEAYIDLLKDKRVALVANHTSMINETHLADSLLNSGINLVKIFSPEHGFRGNADAGQLVSDSIDQITNLPVISLYGKHKKPTKYDLQNIDIVVFDIQDVGARFYTYTSTMHYVMEACAENNIPVLIFDRPNPNGFYVDGPVLDTNYRSFVGMHPVPLVHGMTIAEYARMINEEGWLKNGVKCDLNWIKCANYTHDSLYVLPIKPSPNLPNITSIYLYPSLGLFEGTIVSIGRGTEYPFQVFGHPGITDNGFSFRPREMEGASLNPRYKGEDCYGIDLRGVHSEFIIEEDKIHIEWLIFAYQELKAEKDFFNSYITLLAGNKLLQTQIESDFTEEEIRDSWQEDLNAFKEIRKKYLLYPDFN